MSNPNAAAALDELLDIMARLRGENGCPWDIKQTHQTLTPHLIEEAYETLDAVEGGNLDELKDELGDVLLQVVFHAQIASENGTFEFSDIARNISAKLKRRHPHVFGDVTVSGADEVLVNWDAIKREEKKADDAPKSLLGKLPSQLPALRKSDKLQGRAARVGFDWPDVSHVVAKIEEEAEEVKEELAGGDRERIKDELGDLLFAVVNLCRFCKIDAEDALNGTNRKFMRRFQEIEKRLSQQGKRIEDSSLAEMDAIWDDIKREEKAAQ